MFLKAVAKPQSPASCHSERSEESSLFDKFYILSFIQDDRIIGFATACKVYINELTAARKCSREAKPAPGQVS
jgi:hypothetical protein